jgi:hypothetical protein
MCDGMRIDRRLVLIGVMLIVLSMTMATQYATTKISYSYAIVHPSNADVRFIGSDNSSDDGKRCLRVNTNSSTNRYLTLELGDWFPNSLKNYTAAFGIVNEEGFAVKITHINISSETPSGYITMWLHGDRDADYNGNGAASVKVVSGGSSLFTASNTAWTLAAGDGDVGTMCADGSTQLNTLWDSNADIQYSVNNANNSVNVTSDFVWVGISINVPSNAADAAAATGTIYIHFKAETT